VAGDKSTLRRFQGRIDRCDAAAGKKAQVISFMIFRSGAVGVGELVPR
jgi:hypothetical protein